ncbi:hypothetical protein O181_034535 [Austropuccinia psidii MF-1]|uniref:Thioesterase domain-containing protein n=1 Tax=Austropuccinia psidii MF-1 TaxID=1389203 RepID=A0A9Q3D369_9BASI|nr:hypothetical protein [Austropuccinia psidii MF-1]
MPGSGEAAHPTKVNLDPQSFRIYCTACIGRNEMNSAASRLARLTNHLINRAPSSYAALSKSLTATRPLSDEPTHVAESQWTDPSTYRYWLPIQTRWSDNDSYGHMNNAYYYHLFDTIVNRFLLEKCKEEPQAMGLVVHSNCTYRSPVGFPSTVLLALATEHVGRSSIKWRVSVWHTNKDLKIDDQKGCAAFGTFVHVFVDPKTRKSIQLSKVVREGASNLLVETEMGKLETPPENQGFQA